MPLVIRIGQNSVQSTILSDPQRLERAVLLYCNSFLGEEGAAAMTDEERIQYVVDDLAAALKREARRYRISSAELAARRAAEAENDL